MTMPENLYGKFTMSLSHVLVIIAELQSIVVGLLASRVIQDIGLEMVEGQGLMEVARSLKSTEEIKLIEHSIHVGETGVSKCVE